MLNFLCPHGGAPCLSVVTALDSVVLFVHLEYFGKKHCIFLKLCSGMRSEGNYNKTLWFVYPFYSHESILTCYFDLVDVKVIKLVQQIRDNVQEYAVSSSRMERVETELFRDTSLCIIISLSQAQGLNCCFGCLNDCSAHRLK